MYHVDAQVSSAPILSAEIVGIESQGSSGHIYIAMLVLNTLFTSLKTIDHKFLLGVHNADSKSLFSSLMLDPVPNIHKCISFIYRSFAAVIPVVRNTWSSYMFLFLRVFSPHSVTFSMGWNPPSNRV